MKKLVLLIVLSSFFVGFAQIQDSGIHAIAEAEMKAASGLMNMTVNPNTANYDITYHGLRFTVDPAIYAISGIVTTTYTALSDMSTVTFDLANQLTVSSVTKNGTPLAFVQNTNKELVISLPVTQITGTSATVVITYSGAPPTGEQAFTTQTHNGAPVLYTLSEPFGARDWWPCKQDLSDKVDNIDVYITAPSQYISVSNGLEQSQVINGVTKTTHFKHNYPIPAYLIAIAVTNYSVFTQQAGTAPNQFPIVNYIYPENFVTAQVEVAQTLPIMNLFESLFETYPFSNEKYGHAQFGFGGGMEHTTVSFMANFNRELIAHELAHQWFGDKVTCGSWKDIWLNEGFATYLSGLVRENLDGPAAFVTWKNSLINNITSSAGGALYLTDAEAMNVSRIFSSRLSYNKGAMVVEMLRWKLGDTNFFQGIRNYLADTNLAYKYVVTSDLQSHLEVASGMSLSEFFNDWVYKQGYPTYAITAQNLAPGQVRFVVNQTQSNLSVTYFEMPLPVRVFGSGGQQMDLVLQNTNNGQVFIENVPFTITSVVFDPNKHIISKNNNVTLSNENFELKNAIVLYPNPASNWVTLDVPNGITVQKVIVYNAIGQKVAETTMTTTLDVSALASGIHLMSIITDSGTRQIRFIKN